MDLVLDGRSIDAFHCQAKRTEIKWQENAKVEFLVFRFLGKEPQDYHRSRDRYRAGLVCHFLVQEGKENLEKWQVV